LRPVPNIPNYGPPVRCVDFDGNRRPIALCSPRKRKMFVHSRRCRSDTNRINCLRKIGTITNANDHEARNRGAKFEYALPCGGLRLRSAHASLRPDGPRPLYARNTKFLAPPERSLGPSASDIPACRWDSAYLPQRKSSPFVSRFLRRQLTPADANRRLTKRSHAVGKR